MDDEKTSNNRGWRWLVYFVVSTICLFLIASNIKVDISRDGLFDEYGSQCLGISIVATFIIIVGALAMPQLLSRTKGNGRNKRRMECSSLYGFALFFSAVLSIAGSFGLLFGGAAGLMPFLFVFAIAAFFFIYSSIELALAQFIPGSGWETVFFTSLAVFGPALVVGVFDVCIWLAKFGTFWTFVGAGAALALIYGVIHFCSLDA